ncbi:MAG: AMP-binding protein, partial [Nitrospiraceae bacterium]
MIDAPDLIVQAHRMAGDQFRLPWESFAEFFHSRVHDPALADRLFLSYYDDDRHVHRTYRYAEFGEAVLRMAAFMHDQVRLKRGDRIATVLFNHDQTVLVYFAAWTLGIAVVPINVEETTEKKRYILEHAEVVAVCCWKDCLDEIRSLRPAVPSLREILAVGDRQIEERFYAPVAQPPTSEADNEEEYPHGILQDVALIVYTSGTTGPPKGVILTAENLLMDADAIADWHGFGGSDRLMCVLPIHHVNGAVVTVVTPFYFKGGTVLNRRFKTGTFWRRVQEEQVTCVSVVPT